MPPTSMEVTEHRERERVEGREMCGSPKTTFIAPRLWLQWYGGRGARTIADRRKGGRERGKACRHRGVEHVEGGEAQA